MTGKVVLVTGGSRGVGAGIAQSFLGYGATVVTCARNEPEPAGDAGTAPRSHFMTADVRDAADVDRLITSIEERFGRLDVAVNNAGGSPPAPTATASPRFSTAIVSLNLLAPLFVAQRANAVMQAQDEGGCIINIASINGLRPSPGTVAYGAAKAGLIHLTTTLAVEWAPKVRVNAVTPGIVGTDEILRVHYGGDTARIAELASQVPLGKLGDPADVGNACIFLASRLATHVSGANLLVHGGAEPADSTAASPPK